MRRHEKRYLIVITFVVLLSVLALAGAESHNSSRSRTSQSISYQKPVTENSVPNRRSPSYDLRRPLRDTNTVASQLFSHREESSPGRIAADADPETDGQDPDRPANSTNFDEGEYLLKREQFIAVLRGIQPGKPFDPAARMRANAIMDTEINQIRLAVEKSRNTVQPLTLPDWIELGPNPIPNGQTQTVTTPVSGRVSAIEIDPSDPNKVYVGAAQGGVYRSLDGGATWVPIFDSAQSLAIGALTLDSANGRLWVGTGEANGSADSFAGVGLYRIDNINTTANLVGPINPVRNYLDASSAPQSVPVFNGRSISKILIVPGDPSTLLVGNSGGAIGIGGNPPVGGTIPPAGIRGLYKLSNVTGSPASVTVTKIAVSPGSAGGCFDTPCTGNRNVNDMVFDLSDGTGNTLVVWLNGTNAASDGGIYRSTNVLSGSPTFTQRLSTTSISTSNGRGIFAQSSQNSTLIYVASGEPSTGGTLCNSAANSGALRRSTDGGSTWSAELAGGGGFCDGQCFYNIGIDIVPGATPADKILLGGNVRSTNCQKLEGTSLDGGATLFANTDVGLHADTHVIAIAPSNVNVVYRGDDGGVWKSTDGGATWSSLNNTTFRATQFQSIAVHPTDPDFTIGGTQDNGTEKLTTGPTWIRSDAGDGGYALIDQNATDTTNVTMYHTYFNQSNSQILFARSTNAGASWPSVLGCGGTANGINCSDAVNFYAPMALGPGSPNTVYFGSDRLYRSVNTGTSMTVVSQAPLSANVPISAIAIAPQDDNYRIVGLNNGALFYTTTGSSTLASLDATGGGGVIPDFYVARIVFDPNDKQTAFIALGNYAGGTAASQSHFWRVTNLGSSPVLTSLNGTGGNILPDVPINGLAVDPMRSPRIFAGTDIGVFESEDGGVNWAPYGQGLPRVAVFDMAIQNVKRVVRIATHGRGMWEAPVFAPTAAPASISGTINSSSGSPLAGVTVRLSGASSATTITDVNGNYSFAGVSTNEFYSVTPSLANYDFSPTSRSFSLIADKSDATFVGTAASIVVTNAIDSTEYFVRQQYLDFLDREPDQGGLNYWSNQINACGTDRNCIRDRRIDVSAAFFVEQEFQQTGSFVYRLYKSALGRQLSYAEYGADRQQVIAGPNLDANKQALTEAFVGRAEFVQRYQSNTTAASFVDALLQTVASVGTDLSSERNNLIATYNGSNSINESRALTVRAVAENPLLSQAVYNQAFVLVQYFSYLRRDPDRGGYDFWLNVLNNREPGNYRGMVCAFLTSSEYQRRFSPVITRSNADCGP